MRRVCNAAAPALGRPGRALPRDGDADPGGARGRLRRGRCRAPLSVDAYVIDTGIRFTHAEFGGRAVAGIDEVTPGGTAADQHGHGTHVAGTIGGATFGVAKSVRLIAVRVLDANGSGTIAGVTAGVDWVTADHTSRPAVANMSLGGD